VTTYSTIADSEIDPESPGTTTLFTKLRNNPIAITEGASGAPSILNAALSGYPWGAADMEDAAAGNYLEYNESWTAAEVNTAVGSSMTKMAEFIATRGGTYTFRLSLIGNVSYYGQLRVYLNGSPEGTLRQANSGSPAVRLTVNENIAVSEGDLVQLYGLTQNAAAVPDGSWAWGVMSSNPIAHLSRLYTLRDIL